MEEGAQNSRSLYLNRKKKRAPAIFLTLNGLAYEVVLDLDIEKDLAVDEGVQNVTNVLDAQYLPDERCLVYEA